MNRNRSYMKHRLSGWNEWKEIKILQRVRPDPHSYESNIQYPFQVKKKEQFLIWI